MGEVKLHPNWLEPLRTEFAADYMAALRAFLVAEKAAGKQIFPRGSDWFRALDLTPLALAVSHRSKSDSSSWQPFFDSSTGMKSSILLTPTRVARQAYVEAILLRTLAGDDKEK